ncbi:MAG: hypothetical protein F6K48_09275 [Okeania sp. SIO3H1]|nr:hypothetical protein [Okeania sp. SIO3H1]
MPQPVTKISLDLVAWLTKSEVTTQKRVCNSEVSSECKTHFISVRSLPTPNPSQPTPNPSQEGMGSRGFKQPSKNISP